MLQVGLDVVARRPGPSPRGSCPARCRRPGAALRSAGRARCWTGWVIVVLVSPRLAVIEQMRVASITAKAPGPRRGRRRARFTTKDTTAPPMPPCCAIASACCGCEGKPRVVHPLHLPAASRASAPAPAHVALCACMRIDQRLHALEHHPGIEGRQAHAGAAHHRHELGVDEFLGPAHRTGDHPALAVEVLGAAVHDQVGAQLGRPLQRRAAEAVVHRQQRTGAAWAMSASARMSQTSVSGLVGDSANSSLVLGCIAARQAARSVCEHEGGLHAEAGEVLEQLDRRAEHALRTHHVVAGLQQRHHAASVMAAMPLLVAMQPVVPSSAASRRSIIVTVGLREAAVDEGVFLVGEAPRRWRRRGARRSW